MKKIPSTFALVIPALICLAARPLLAASAENHTLVAAAQALERGDREQALRLIDQAVQADPKDPAGFALRAAVYDALRQFDEAVIDYGTVIKLSAQPLAAYQQRGEDQFRLGHFKESVADFDKVIELDPAREPYHWQRGISLYYAGAFERGAKQFERHRTVNPDDVENAVWHYLCVARTSGVIKAKEGLIPIEGDGRVPMMQVYAMFAGKTTPQAVLDAAKAGAPPDEELKRRLFYAHLYIGLFDEAAGHTDAAKEHIGLAADKYADDDYMGDVARAHAKLLRAPPAPK